MYAFYEKNLFLTDRSYFELLDVLQQTNPSQVLQRSREELGLQGSKQLQALVVPLYEFLLFLFAQLYNKGSPRVRKMEDVYVFSLAFFFLIVHAVVARVHRDRHHPTP